MLNVTLICVGKMKEKFYLDAAAEYAKRLGGYCRLKVVELPECRLPQAPSRGDVNAALAREGEQILARLPKSGKVIAMCVEGQALDSPGLADKLARWALDGASDVTFVVGGSFGLSQAVKSRADLRLSMSAMTFPHHLARVMLLEQIYRAFKIQEGSGYHK